MPTRRRSQRAKAFGDLQKEKSAQLRGKSTLTKVNEAAKDYLDASEKRAQKVTKDIMKTAKDAVAFQKRRKLSARQKDILARQNGKGKTDRTAKPSSSAKKTTSRSKSTTKSTVKLCYPIKKKQFGATLPRTTTGTFTSKAQATKKLNDLNVKSGATNRAVVKSNCGKNRYAIYGKARKRA